VDSNVKTRGQEAEKAESIVAEEVETFLRWQSSLDAVPTIIALREKADAVKKTELEKFISKYPDLDDKQRKALDYMASAIVNKLIHPPTAALKEDTEDKDELIAILKKLYGIEGE
jgi:glutamyl-tRNA reductase